MKILCMSDTHDRLRWVWSSWGSKGQAEAATADVLVHAGDLTMAGDRASVRTAIEEISELPVKHKVVIAGNHDF